jgi:C4-dicarboxylate-specific signal transduction histidine kinase
MTDVSPFSPSQRDHRRLRQLEHALRFLGRQTAGQTHELTNVLNIINELTGLVEDLVLVSARTGDMDPTRIQESLEKIQTQIQRGEELLRGLNRLAHSVDEPRCLFTWSELLDRVQHLAHRSLRLQRARLEPEAAPPDVSLEGSLIAYQQVILTAVNAALWAGGENVALRLSCEPSDDGEYVTVHVESDSAASAPQDAEPTEHGTGPAAAGSGAAPANAPGPLLEQLVATLGGRVLELPSPGVPIRVALSLPCR